MRFTTLGIPIRESIFSTCNSQSSGGAPMSKAEEKRSEGEGASTVMSALEGAGKYGARGGGSPFAWVVRTAWESIEPRFEQ